MNDHWNVLYQVSVFYADQKSKMATTAGHKLTLDPMWNLKVCCSDMKFKMAATAGPYGKNVSKRLPSSLKPLGQLKPNCPGMIIGRSSTKYMFFMSIGNPRWPPEQDIDWHWTLCENVQMSSFQKLQVWLKPNCTWMFIGWSSTNSRRADSIMASFQLICHVHFLPESDTF